MDIKLYYKPTGILQRCPVCGRVLEKGELIAKVLSGFYKFPQYSYYHPECLILGIKRRINNELSKFDVGKSFIKKLGQ